MKRKPGRPKGSGKKKPAEVVIGIKPPALPRLEDMKDTMKTSAATGGSDFNRGYALGYDRGIEEGRKQLGYELRRLINAVESKEEARQ